MESTDPMVMFASRRHEYDFNTRKLLISPYSSDFANRHSNMQYVSQFDIQPLETCFSLLYVVPETARDLDIHNNTHAPCKKSIAFLSLFNQSHSEKAENNQMPPLSNNNNSRSQDATHDGFYKATQHVHLFPFFFINH
jgi:hypothetical protein